MLVKEMPDQPPLVLIVAPQSLHRDGLKAIIEEDAWAAVAGVAEDAGDAVELAQKTRPEILLADVDLRGGSGVELVERLRTHLPKMRALLLGPPARPKLVEECLRAGAAGFLPRDVPREEFIKCLHSILTTEQFLTPAQGATSGGFLSLTARETLIMLRIAQGKTTRQIAEELVISPKTVVNHRARLMSKLRVETPVGIVRYAARSGLIDLR